MLFLVITVFVLAFNIRFLIIDPSPAWYTYVVIGLLGPIGIFVLYKVFIRYKTVSFGNNQIEIRFPVLQRQSKYPLQEIKFWRETEVKTGKTASYKELEIRFTDGTKITMGHREVTEYSRMIQYLNQKLPRKKSN